MHDIHAESVNALPKVIDYLKGQGYDFVTIPDLLDARLKTSSQRKLISLDFGYY